MKYDFDSKIATINDVENFIKHLYYDRHLAWEPCEDFANYIDTDTDEPSFGSTEVMLYNKLMKESNDVCEYNKVDICELGLKYHPLLN